MGEIVFKKPKCLLEDVPYTFCPGCTHGIVHNLVGACIDELGVQGDTIMVTSVGCGGMNWAFWDTDTIYSMHGRAPANATGIKRMKPDKFVFTYQGDGDLASIGVAEIIHSAARGENITVFFINNAIYGMTGGQMAPTTLIGQKTTTAPYGRDQKLAGMPLAMVEMLATVEGASYIERVSVCSVKHIRQAKTSIKKALTKQIDSKGFSLIEIISTCPTNWKMTPAASMEWANHAMIKRFPLGITKEAE